MLPIEANFRSTYDKEIDNAPHHILIDAKQAVAIKVDDQILIKYIKQEEQEDNLALAVYNSTC